MNNNTTKFEGSIPENYDRYLGPLLFEFSAKDLASRVENIVSANSSLLEIACGTGISTAYLRNALPENISILATDVSEDMLKIAREKRGSLPGVNYQIEDATQLSFTDNNFDAVVCQFGIMFFPDKDKGLSEMIRVLKPGSLFAMNVWDNLEQNPFVKIALDTVATFFENDPPVFLKMPFGFNDINHITNMMEHVGLTDIEYHIVTEVVDHIEAKDVARGAVTGNPTISAINANPDLDVEDVIDAVTSNIEKALGQGKPDIKLQEIVFTGHKEKI